MKKILYIIGVAALAMTSCSKDNETTDVNNDNRITFGSSIEATTRAVGETDEQFSNGDAIGVIGYREASESATTDFTTPFMNKVEFTFNDTSGQFTSISTDAYWQRGKAHNFYAYYPINLTFALGANNVAPKATLAVTAGTGIGIDVMQAKAETAAFNSSLSSATLPFTHSLSKVKFLVKKESNTPLSVLSKVEFTMANNSGSFDVSTGAVANSGSSVVMTKTGLNQTINTDAAQAVADDWIVLPADVISGVKLTINGQEVTATGLDGITTVQGKITTITITVKAVGIEMTSSITKWGTEDKSGTVG